MGINSSQDDDICRKFRPSDIVLNGTEKMKVFGYRQENRTKVSGEWTDRTEEMGG
jgi:hypothetical protein